MERVEEMLSKLLLSSNNDIYVLKTLAQVKTQLKKYGEAAEFLSQAIMLKADSEREDDLEELYIERGNNYIILKMYQEALLDYEAALRTNPRHPSAHGNCGAIYHLNGSIEKARYHYKKAQELDPDDDILRQNIAKLERLQYKRDIGVG